MTARQVRWSGLEMMPHLRWPPACSGGGEVLEWRKWTPWGTSPSVTRPPSHISVHFPHVSFHFSQNCLNSHPCQRMMGTQPCNSMYCIHVFSKTGKNKFWKVKGMSKVKEDTSAAEGGPEAIHHWQSPSLPPDCHKASFLQAGHCPGCHLHSLLHWQKPWQK